MVAGAVDAKWDWVDRVLIDAWGEFTEDMCQQCGRPRQMHAEDHVDDYFTAFYTCTAAEALDQFQAKWAKTASSLPAPALRDARADKTARNAGRNPDRARTWFTWTREEGTPR